MVKEEILLQIKRILSILLTIALLCALPVAASAKGKDLRKKDVSGYPSITFHGGFHELYYNENTPQQTMAFDPGAVGGIMDAVSGDLLKAVATLNMDGAADILKQAMWDWFGEIRMDESGRSVNKGLSSDGPYRLAEYEGGPGFDTDWRLSPIENADRLHKYLQYAEKRYGVKKFNLDGLSAHGATVLAYLDKYGTDKVASLVFNISMHRGSSIFGAIAKKEFRFNMEALSRVNSFDALGLDLAAFQPILRALFETGLLDVLVRFLRLASSDLLDRVYEEVVIPLFFMMPSFWVYVPLEDYEAAKEILLKGDPKYAGLVKKIDAYYKIAQRADDIILEASKTMKVAVWAGYGQPLVPVGDGASVQSDTMLDTHYGSLGATCAPPGKPFDLFYQQQVDDGHDHISPDRLVDASTCLLPDQTWFAKNKTHGSDIDYDGWRGWFYTTDDATVFANPRYPQFMEKLEDGQFIPVTDAPSKIGVIANNAFLESMETWRRVVLLPLFWIK